MKKRSASGASPPDPTGALPLDPELNFTKSVCSVMSIPLVYDVVYHLVLWEEVMLKRKHNAA